MRWLIILVIVLIISATTIYFSFQDDDLEGFRHPDVDEDSVRLAWDMLLGLYIDNQNALPYHSAVYALGEFEHATLVTQASPDYFGSLTGVSFFESCSNNLFLEHSLTNMDPQEDLFCSEAPLSWYLIPATSGLAFEGLIDFSEKIFMNRTVVLSAHAFDSHTRADSFFTMLEEYPALFEDMHVRQHSIRDREKMRELHIELIQVIGSNQTSTMLLQAMLRDSVVIVLREIAVEPIGYYPTPRLNAERDHLAQYVDARRGRVSIHPLLPPSS